MVIRSVSRRATEAKNREFLRTLSHRRASTEWTIGKLMSFILLAVFLILIFLGPAKALNALKDKAVSLADNVMIMFHLKKPASSAEPIRVEIPGVGFGNLIINERECKIDLDNNLLLSPGLKQKEANSFSFEIKPSSSTFNYFYNLQGKTGWEILDVPNIDMKKYLIDKEAYVLLSGALNPSSDFEEFKRLSNPGKASIEFKIDSEGDDVFIINEGLEKWTRKEGDKTTSISDDEKALKEVYWESDDISFMNPDDKVYWRIIHGSIAVEYQIIPGMAEEEGEIDSPQDFETFKNWFFGVKNNLLNTMKPNSKNIETFRDTRLKYARGIFQNGDVDLSIELDGSDAVLFFSQNSKQYGVKHSGGLNLYAYENGKWAKSRTDIIFLKSDAGGQEAIIKLNLVRNFLLDRCQ